MIIILWYYIISYYYIIIILLNEKVSFFGEAYKYIYGLLAILIVFLRQLIVPPGVSGCYMKHLQLHDNNYHQNNVFQLKNLKKKLCQLIVPGEVSGCYIKKFHLHLISFMIIIIMMGAIWNILFILILLFMI